MSENVTVRALRMFEGSVEGRLISPGDAIEVTRARAAELKANGLVEDVANAPVPPEAPEAPPAEDPADEAPRRGRKAS